VGTAPATLCCRTRAWAVVVVFVAHARSGSPAILLGGVVADEIWVLDLIWSTPKWQMLNTTKRKARISTQNPSDIRRPASVTCREQIQSFPQTRLSACHEAKNKKGQGKTARGMWGRGCFVLATFISRDKCCCSPAPVWGLCRHSSARSSVTCPYTALHVCIAICSARMGATLPHASPRPLPALFQHTAVNFACRLSVPTTTACRVSR
jgi:hypothetical protein